MEIRQAVFVASNTQVDKCPPPEKPEFAFIGRSNVGKSSLINMITQRKSLAKTSGRPGKTQTINHFLINDAWYLVDLPGYGYASAGKDLKRGWIRMIEQYLLTRQTLYCLFILIDARHPLQTNDSDFIRWAGESDIAICLVLTKSDKLTRSERTISKRRIETALLQTWQELPPVIFSSAPEKTGREEIIGVMEAALNPEN